MIFPINAEKSFDEMEDPFNLKPVRGKKKEIEGNFLNLIQKVPIKIRQLILYLMVKD